MANHDFQDREGRRTCTKCGACTDPECCPGEVGRPCWADDDMEEDDE